jgi:hypothetical protein
MRIRRPRHTIACTLGAVRCFSSSMSMHQEYPDLARSVNTAVGGNLMLYRMSTFLSVRIAERVPA